MYMYMYVSMYAYTRTHKYDESAVQFGMGWLRLVGSLKY